MKTYVKGVTYTDCGGVAPVGTKYRFIDMLYDNNTDCSVYQECLYDTNECQKRTCNTNQMFKKAFWDDLSKMMTHTGCHPYDQTTCLEMKSLCKRK